MTNSTLAENAATLEGGAIYTSDFLASPGGLLLIQSSTIANNSAGTSAGGIRHINQASAVSLRRTIVAGNVAPQGPDLFGAFGTGDLSVDSLNPVLVGDPTDSGLSTPAILIGDPKLAPLDDFGGPSMTMPALPGSPVLAIADYDEAYNASTAFGAFDPLIDQRGAPRLAEPQTIGSVAVLCVGCPDTFLPSIPLIDTDGDGIDDRLEPAYPLLTVGVDDRGVDSDGDGATDALELSLFFDPTDSGNTPPLPPLDTDADGWPDEFDNCPNDANGPDAGPNDQLDQDVDGLGDVCDVCASDPNNDIDGDGICGDVDNCPLLSNPGQEDDDMDGVGNICVPEPSGPFGPVGAMVTAALHWSRGRRRVRRD